MNLVQLWGCQLSLLYGPCQNGDKSRWKWFPWCQLTFGKISGRNKKKNIGSKAKFAEESTFFLRTDFLPWEFLFIKKLEIEKTKTTFTISVLKVVY